METKFSHSIYYYQFEGDEYEIGKKYGKLLKDRNFDSNKIEQVNQKMWKVVEGRNPTLLFKILQKKILGWVNIIKKDFSDYILIQKGFSEELKMNLDILLELEILIELSGIFCTIYAENKNKFYRIADTSIEHRQILKETLQEIHVVKINDYVTVTSPGLYTLHSIFSEKFSFATFANNQIPKKEFLKNPLPFYIRFKKIYANSKNENQFIQQIIEEKDVYFDVEIIIGGQDNNYNVHAINKTLKESNIIERSDYTPIKTDDFMNLHKELPDFNRIFAAYYYNNKLYLSNSLVNNEMIEIF